MNAGLVTLMVVIAILGIVFGPMVAIWSINTLFGLTVAYTLKNWFAMLLIMVFFGKSSVTVKSSK